MLLNSLKSNPASFHTVTSRSFSPREEWGRGELVGKEVKDSWPIWSRRATNDPAECLGAALASKLSPRDLWPHPLTGPSFLLCNLEVQSPREPFCSNNPCWSALLGRHLPWFCLEVKPLIPRSETYPGESSGYPLQYSFLENPLHRKACQATLHGVTKRWTRLSGYH